jgi:surface protein
MKFTEIPFNILKDFFLNTKSVAVKNIEQPYVFNQYTVSSIITEGIGNGIILPENVLTVYEGGYVSLNIIPNEGYYGSIYIDGIFLQDTNVGEMFTYTFNNIRSDHLLEVEFNEQVQALPFILNVQTANTFTLPLVDTGEYDFIVDWGDETSNTITEWDDVNVTHTYAASGSYDISITGTMKGWSPNWSSHWWSINWNQNIIKIKNLKQWGIFSFANTDSHFAYYYDDFIITATDIPNFSDATSLEGTFAYNYYITNIPNINSWDVSTITNMKETFRQCEAFNSYIGSWDTSNVETMFYMFHLCLAFNQDIGNWDVSNVENFAGMFSIANEFNQDISRWDTSSATDMNSMFIMQSHWNNFNQPIGLWDVSKVTNFNAMFMSCTGFNQPLSNWDISSAIDIDYMFDELTLSTTYYDDILTSWAQQDVTTGLLFRAGNSKYSLSGQDARNYLVNTKGWIIYDGGLQDEAPLPA